MRRGCGRRPQPPKKTPAPLARWDDARAPPPPAVLRKLELVTEEEAEQKRAALRAVRDAFVWREVRARPRPPRNASRANATWLRRGVERNGAVLPADPSAADYLLGELCAAAKRKRLGLSMPAAPSGGVERCML